MILFVGEFDVILLDVDDGGDDVDCELVVFEGVVLFDMCFEIVDVMIWFDVKVCVVGKFYFGKCIMQVLVGGVVVCGVDFGFVYLFDIGVGVEEVVEMIFFVVLCCDFYCVVCCGIGVEYVCGFQCVDYVERVIELVGVILVFQM